MLRLRLAISYPTWCMLPCRRLRLADDDALIAMLAALRGGEFDTDPQQRRQCSAGKDAFTCDVCSAGAIHVKNVYSRRSCSSAWGDGTVAGGRQGWT